jgi:hypothetical protein
LKSFLEKSTKAIVLSFATKTDINISSSLLTEVKINAASGLDDC